MNHPTPTHGSSVAPFSRFHRLVVTSFLVVLVAVIGLSHSSRFLGSFSSSNQQINKLLAVSTNSTITKGSVVEIEITNATKFSSTLTFDPPATNKDTQLKASSNKITPTSTTPKSLRLRGLETQFKQGADLFWKQFTETPLSPQEIATRYGIPQTNLSSAEACGENNTTNATITVGWIPCRANNCSSSSSLLGGRIPRLIFQSWKTRHVSPNLCRALVRWVDLNPQFDYFLFDNTAVETMLKVEFGANNNNAWLNAWNCLAIGAAKADVWRLIVIYLYGGLYFDLDAYQKIHPFDSWEIFNNDLENNDLSVVTGNGCVRAMKRGRMPHGCPSQWALIYARRHDIIKTALEFVMKNLAQRDPHAHIYDIAFWALVRDSWSVYHNEGKYDFIPRWGDNVGGHVTYVNPIVKDEMIALSNGSGWGDQIKKNKGSVWHESCLDDD